MLNLGTLGGPDSNACGINEAGQVVGYSDITGSSDSHSHAFIYSRAKLLDLNNLVAPNSGWILYSATGINDRGQIVGYGSGPISNNGTHGFLLTPVPVRERFAR
jgi:probable HAF family extracellular repeat protein